MIVNDQIFHTPIDFDKFDLILGENRPTPKAFFSDLVFAMAKKQERNICERYEKGGLISVT